MSQIFSGEGLGLKGSSIDSLGGYGPKGDSKLGQAGEQVYVNAANGNLVLRQSDGFLAEHDLGLNLVQTYNSQGTLSNQRWQFNVATKVSDLSGSLNSKGSTITRTDEAGHRSVFVYDESAQCYLANDGSTSRLSFSNNEWLYQSGSGDISYHYNAEGLLIAKSNKDGLSFEFHYQDGVLTEIRDCQNNQSVKFSYENGLLKDITTYSEGEVLHHIHYDYDDLGRLTTVTRDIGEDDKQYTINYRYDGDSNRISDISQSDGSQFHIEYDSQGRVKLTRDGAGRSLHYDYQDGKTIVTNDKNEQWSYYYNADCELTAIDGPEGLHIDYHYRNHRLESINQGGLSWHFEYNGQGDCIKIIDEKGQVTERSFDSHHRLTCETHYQRFDGEHHAIDPIHEYYVYDEAGHLRFKIAANGAVTEYQYDSDGNQIKIISYLNANFDSSAYNADNCPGLSQLTSWAEKHSDAIDHSDYQYDALGQINCITHGDTVTEFRYDAAGRLREKTYVYDGKRTTTSYVYDDLGRLILTRDNQGVEQHIDYDDAHSRIITYDANGLQTIEIFDKSGLLLSQHKLDDTQDFGTQTYYYDEAGRLIRTVAADGNTTRYFYDSRGRKQAQVTNNGEVTEYRYDAYGNLIETKAYARLIQTDSLKDDNVYADIKPTDSNDDRAVKNLYDTHNQLIYRIDGSGAVIEYRYDALSRVISQRAYAKRIDIATVSDIDSVKLEKSDSDDRINRFFYDEMGNKIAQVDGEGFVTEYRYDNRGLLTAEIRHINKAHQGESWQQVKPDDNPYADIKSYYYYNATGQKIAKVDAEKYLTCYQYDSRGNLEKTVSYYNKLTASIDESSDILTLIPVADNNDHSISYRYNDLNQLSEEVHYSGKNSNNGLTIVYDYDEAGNVIKTCKTDNREHNSRQIQSRYDSMGRVIASLDELGAALLQQQDLTDEAIEAIWQQHSIKYSYGLNGLLTSQTNQLGQVTHFYYDDNRRLQYTIDDDGNIVEKRYNAFNQLASEIHYAGKLKSVQDESLNSQPLAERIAALKDEQHDEVINYLYSLSGNVKSKAIGNSSQHYQYNAFGELEQTTSAINEQQSNISQYVYDKRGLLTHRFDVVQGDNKRDIETRYDEFGRVKQEYDANHELVNTYIYSKVGNVKKVINSTNGIKSSRYDAYGRIISKTNFSSGDDELTYSYNDTTNTTTIEYLDSGSVTTTLNAFGDKIKVIDGNDNITEFHYDEKGLLHDVVQADKTTLEYHYDDSGLLTWSLDADKHKTAFSYDASGHVLTKTIDPDGLKLATTYQYDGIGRQLNVTSGEGRVETFEYNQQGQVIKSIIDPDGLAIETQYLYDSAGNKIAQMRGDASGMVTETRYQYDNLNRLTATIIDPDGLNITNRFEYDSNDNVITKIDANGNSRHFLYDANNHCRFSIDASGVVTEHQYDKNNNESATIIYADKVDASENYTIESLAGVLCKDDDHDHYEFRNYDAQGRLAVVFNSEGYATRYVYDGNGNILRKIAYEKQYSLAELRNDSQPDPADEKTAHITYFCYDSMDRMTYQVSGDGAVTKYQYDRVGNVSSTCQLVNRLSLDKLNGNLTSEFIESNLVSDSLHDHLERRVYDKAGRLSYQVNANGYVTAFEYDKAGHLTQTKNYARAINPDASDITAALMPDSENDRINYRLYDKAGREVFRISSDGFVLERRYDRAGNVCKEISHAQTLGSSEKSLAQLTTAEVKQFYLQSSLDDRMISYYYDKADRLHETVDAMDYHEIYNYDDAGNVTSKVDKNSHEWTYHYDESNQLISEESPEVTISVYRNGAWVSEQRKVVTEYRYDAFGNKLKIINDKGYGNQTIEYRYDRLNRQVCVIQRDVTIDASGINTSSDRQQITKDISSETVYDSFGNVAAVKDYAGNWRHFVYDNVGNKLFDVDANGAVTKFSYDAFGNTTAEIRYANRIEITRDNPILSKDQVKVQDSSDDRTTRYEHDNLNQLISEKHDKVRYYDPISNDYALAEPTTEYRYNAFGQLIETRQMRSPDDWVVTRNYYDLAGRKRAVVDGENYVTEYYYNQFGDLDSQREFANKTSDAFDINYHPVLQSDEDRVTRFSYDKLGQLTAKVLTDVSYQQINANGTGYETITRDLTTRYSYDGLGHITSTTDVQGNTNYNYYDERGNVIAQVGPAVSNHRAAKTFGYDALGNVVLKKEWARGATSATLDGYTLAGSDSKDRLEQSVYDNNGRVSEVIDANGATIHYSYDENGNVARTWREVSDADGSKHVRDIRYRYDVNGHQIDTLTLERDGSWVNERAIYNSFGELIQTDYNGKFAIKYDYDNQGRVWRHNKDGFYQIFVYDLSDNVTQVVTSTNTFITSNNEMGVDLSADGYKDNIRFDIESKYKLQRTSNTYDKLGHLTFQVREKAESAVGEHNGTIKQAHQSWRFDRWGNQLEHVDALTHKVIYRYNKFNQLIYQQMPEVDSMDEHGVVTKVQPVTRYLYDDLGRLVGMIDANEHLATKQYDSYDNVVTETDALGHARHKQYDLFGNVTLTEDEMHRVTRFDYDANNQLLSTTNNNGEVTTYTNNELGQRLSQQNSGHEKLTNCYDNRGNILAKTDIRGVTTDYSYDEGSHKINEVDGNGNSQHWDYNDVDARLDSHTDLAGKKTNYEYNTNGLLHKVTSDYGKEQIYHYWADGSIRQIDDQGSGELIAYTYDDAGNLKSKETSVRGDNDHSWICETDYYDYDALGRLTKVVRRNPEDIDRRYPDTDHQLFSIEYHYDAANNIRYISSWVNYHVTDPGSGSIVSKDVYFSYDANNRMLINQGSLVDGEIVITQTQGSSLHYNDDGSILDATKYKLIDGVYHAETYTYEYDGLGRTQRVSHYFDGRTKASARLSRYEYDYAGRVVTEHFYNSLDKTSQTNVYRYGTGAEQGLLKEQTMFEGDNHDKSSKVESNIKYNQYDAVGNLLRYELKVNDKGEAKGYTVTHNYTYLKRDSYLQEYDRASTVYDTATTTGESHRIYDVNGNLSQSIDSNNEHSVTYLNDVIDGVKVRKEQHEQRTYLNVGGHNIGDLRLDLTKGVQELTLYGGFTPEGSAQRPESHFVPGTKEYDRAKAKTPIYWSEHKSLSDICLSGFMGSDVSNDYGQTMKQAADGTPVNSAQDNIGSYTVRAGDSLESIAQEVYGDASLWYLIADANGISGSQSEQAGHNPNSHNQANQSRNLQVGQQLTLPAANGSQHHTNATHTVQSQAQLLGDISATTPNPPPPPPPPQKHQKWWKKVLVGIATIVAIAVLAPVLGPELAWLVGLKESAIAAEIASGFVAGFAGNLAGQAMSVALNMQHGINVGSALMTGFIGAATAGVAQFGPVKNVVSKFDGLKVTEYFNPQSAAKGFINDSVSQLSNMAFHKQKNFHWEEVAGASATAGVMGGKASKDLEQSLSQADSSGHLASAAENFINKSAQTLIGGGHYDLTDILTDSIGNEAAATLTRQYKQTPGNKDIYGTESKIQNAFSLGIDDQVTNDIYMGILQAQSTPEMTVADTLSETYNSLVEGAQNLWSDYGADAYSLYNTATAAYSNVINHKSDYGWESAIVDSVAEVATSAYKGFDNAASGLSNFAMSMMENPMGGIRTMANGLGNLAYDFLASGSALGRLTLYNKDVASRNTLRMNAVKETYNNFVDGSAASKIEMLTKSASNALFAYASGGASEYLLSGASLEIGTEALINTASNISSRVKNAVDSIPYQLEFSNATFSSGGLGGVSITEKSSFSINQNLLGRLESYKLWKHENRLTNVTSQEFQLFDSPLRLKTKFGEYSNREWPPNSGLLGEPNMINLKPGTLIDRFGSDYGSYLSPYGESYASRALRPGTQRSQYSVFKIKKEIKVEAGTVRPWFGQSGKGTQYRLYDGSKQLRVNQLLDEYLEPVYRGKYGGYHE